MEEGMKADWTEEEYETVSKIRNIVRKHNIGTRGLWEICKLLRSKRINVNPDDWVATPKRKKPLKERLNKLSAKIKVDKAKK